MDCIDCCVAETTACNQGGVSTMRRQPFSSARDSSQMAAVNPYQVLELRRDAVSAEIVQSYRKLALWHHPGRSGRASPEERRRRLQFFEILSACYETLMHNESRRRYDVSLKRDERKRLTGLVVASSSASHTTSEATFSKFRNNPQTTLIGLPSLAASAQSSRVGYRPHHTLTRHMIKQEDSVPCLAHSSSSDASSPSKLSSDDTLNQHQIAQLGSSFSNSKAGCSLVCASNLPVALSPVNLAAKSKSLIVGDSSASHSSANGGEIHFTERTVDRLFGGPLAPLHRARNFEPFSDPFDVFERVFGSPIFPRVEEETMIVESQDHARSRTPSNHRNDLALTLRAPWNHKQGWVGSVHKDEDGRTTAFVSSRVFRDRKITRTETIYVNPDTGETTSEVKVESENLLDDCSETSDNGYDGACEWLVCHRQQNDASAQQVDRQRMGDGEPAAIHEGCGGLYGNAVNEFYQLNRDLYGACTGYMGCTD